MPRSPAPRAPGSASHRGRSVAIVAAHPDDEVLGLGGRLADLPALTLVHLTDGAPLDLSDARSAGYASRDSYAHARERELERALAAAAAVVEHRIAFGIVDQEAVWHLSELTGELAAVLEGVDSVFTHPYEGGHPDHDAAAFIVQAACARLARDAGRAPRRLEFASYHARGTDIVRGAFWPDPLCAETVIELDSAQAARKRAALAQFVTQRSVIAEFPVEIERSRAAPYYDFANAAAPPPPGAALYDRFGWPLNSALWRREAARVLAELQ